MSPLEHALFRALTGEWQDTHSLRNAVSTNDARPALHDVAASLRILRRRSQSPTWVRDRVEREARGTDGHAWRRVKA
jgi:hypothetical protein